MGRLACLALPLMLPSSSSSRSHSLIVSAMLAGSVLKAPKPPSKTNATFPSCHARYAACQNKWRAEPGWVHWWALTMPGQEGYMQTGEYSTEQGERTTGRGHRGAVGMPDQHAPLARMRCREQVVGWNDRWRDHEDREVKDGEGGEFLHPVDRLYTDLTVTSRKRDHDYANAVESSPSAAVDSVLSACAPKKRPMYTSTEYETSLGETTQTPGRWLRTNSSK